MTDILITYEEGKGYEIIQGNKRTGQLSYDEMLGLTSALTMPVSRPCIQWLKTEQEWDEWQNRMTKIKQ